MKKQLKNIILILFFILVLVLVVKLARKSVNDNDFKVKERKTPVAVEDKNYMLEGYPVEEVPLYESEMISSMKFFVNHDPLNLSSYFGQLSNYYNVVFKTQASQDDFIKYYRKLVTNELTEYSSNSQVSGTVGKYNITASHYGHEYGYLQVYLPREEYSSQNRFHAEYPQDIIEIDPNLIERENSYGLLNQNGGEVEHTRYFNFIESLPEEWEGNSPFEILYQQYIEKYKDKEAFSAIIEDKRLTWKDGEYSVVIIFEESHGRVYLNMRKPI